MIGHQFDHGDEICGAVVNVRGKAEKIALWTKNAANETAQVVCFLFLVSTATSVIFRADVYPKYTMIYIVPLRILEEVRGEVIRYIARFTTFIYVPGNRGYLKLRHTVYLSNFIAFDSEFLSCEKDIAGS